MEELDSLNIMAVFRYKMQNVLNIKLQLENQANMEYGMKLAKLREEEEKLQVLQDRKQAYIDKGLELLTGILDPLEIASNKASVIKMDEYIGLQKEAIEEAEDQVELARRKLTMAMQERKIHERLRENALEAFLQEEKEKEKKEIDELTSFTYGQKAQEEAG